MHRSRRRRSTLRGLGGSSTSHIDLLKGEIEAAYSGGVTIADDKERAKLEAKLGELEHQEERTIREAAAAGVRIARRAEVNPAVLLAG